MQDADLHRSWRTALRKVSHLKSISLFGTRLNLTAAGLLTGASICWLHIQQTVVSLIQHTGTSDVIVFDRLAALATEGLNAKASLAH